jgi:hypothetical protein
MMRSHFSSEDQELENGRVMNFGDALYTRNAVAFKQKLQNHLSLFDGQVHAVKRILARLQKRLRALAAFEALVAVAVFTVALAFGSAVVTRHCESP